MNGTPLKELLSEDKIEAIIQRTRKAGSEIVGLLKTGSAYYAPSASTVEMVKAILGDENKTLPCSVYLDGQYGLSDVYCGVPVKLSAAGVSEIIEIELSDQEKKALEQSSQAVKENIRKL